jgi:hypothetical protein
MGATEYERLTQIADDYELAVLEDLAERAGIIEKDAETGWITVTPATPEPVWAVLKPWEEDGIYLFADEEQARRFSECYCDAVLTSEPIAAGSGAEDLIRAAGE